MNNIHVINELLLRSNLVRANAKIESITYFRTKLNYIFVIMQFTYNICTARLIFYNLKLDIRPHVDSFEGRTLTKTGECICKIIIQLKSSI